MEVNSDIWSKRKHNLEKKEDLYKSKKNVYIKSDAYQLAKFLKSLTSVKYQNNDFAGTIYDNYYNNYPKYQRVTFKMSYSNMMNSHLTYINDYIIQKTKSSVIDKPEAFGTEENVYKENINERSFKWIVSPENQNIDLNYYAEKIIKRMELLTGYKFYWRAAIHKDTGHKHLHICINGKDKNGKKIFFTKEMVKNNIRNTLSSLATTIIGYRTEQEIEAAKKNLHIAKRWTELDERILSFGNIINYKKIPNELQLRLNYLTSLKLAKLNDNQIILTDNWEQILKITGRYNNFFEEYLKNPNIQFYNGQDIKGKILKTITFDKDESWNDAVIIQTNSGQVYVPVYQLHRDNIENQDVFIKGKQTKTQSLGRDISDKDIHIINNDTYTRN